MGERRGVPSQPGADELLTAPGSRVPHHGPVTRDCPVECLLTVLSFRSFNPLARAYDAPFAEPRTVGDVMDLYTAASSARSAASDLAAFLRSRLPWSWPG